MTIGGHNGRHRDPSQTLYGGAYQASIIDATIRSQLAAAHAEALARIRAEETIKDTGVEFGETIGWRCWFANGGLLKSTYRESIWLPNEPMVSASDDIKQFRGIHAFKTLDQALSYYGSSNGVVTGRVAMWGKITEYSRGYVAQYAYPHSVDLICSGYRSPRADNKTLNEIRASYGLDLIPLRDIDKEMGATLRHRFVALMARTLRI